ncbi:replication Fork Protection Component Swi3 [Ostertagia ostertagi]
MDDEFGEINEFFGNDFSDNEPDEDGAEASTDQVLNNLLEKENQEVVKKRAKSRPQPKLNEATLIGPKGIKALQDSFKNFKPDTKNDPYDNLTVMLKKYEHWAHVMFPKLKFEDVINRCEVLGDKRAVKIIQTENNEEDARSRRSDSDDENYYDPLESTFSKGKSSDGKTAEKSSSASTTTVPLNGDVSNEDEIELMESAELARRQALEEEQRRREEEELALADEIMDDFDMY